MSIPAILYRGDEDRNSIRGLKTTLHFYQLQTNLLKGGQGHAVFNTPIIDLVAMHVDSGWAKTHFLSFSEDKITALRFGLNCKYDEVEYLLENYEEYFEDDQNWTFAVIAIDTRSINWNPIETGIYYGSYEPSLTKFNVYPGFSKVILIDVAKAILRYPDHPNYSNVLTKAIRDLEWLLLPATEILMNTTSKEFSGIMDGKCISEIIKYKRIRYIE